MNRKHFAVIAILFLTAIAACRKEGTPKALASAEPGPSASAASPQPGDQHAPAKAVAGSHEDWCAEHKVPESMCTRCNPSLIAAFKATKDWCDEHAVPESQCLLCNPNLKIERPPKPKGAV